MRIAVFSTHEYDKKGLECANKGIHELKWIKEPLNEQTATLAQGFDAAIVFANDDVGSATLDELKRSKVRYVTTRSAGYNHIDIAHAKSLGIKVAYVPEYSPNSIAEHTVGLVLALNRHLIESNDRVSRYDFHIDGLTGFDLKNKTVGIIGTGHIGQVAARIFNGFGCHILAYDISPRIFRDYGVKYVSLDELCRQSDIITLHIPLNDNTHYLINENLIKIMKPGVMLINTSRGAVIDTQAVYSALQTGQIGYLGLDVYEHEKGLFFKDHSGETLKDTLLKSLIEHPNVLITAHHAFLTDTALRNIADTTFYNINCWANGFRSKNELA